MPDLISKYNRAIPRYTSYPPANFFAPDYDSSRYVSAIEASNEVGIRALSFYIHVPFCPRLCHYCACNAYAMEARPRVEAYMQAVLDEIDLVCQHLDRTRPITQIHYGGGTPTAVPLHWLALINDKLRSYFPLAPEAEIAIECHPGYLSLAAWQELIDAGFNRVSIGVQDFHPEVLEGVNRAASRERFEDIFALLRAHGLRINLDLIYGLPRQTPESFEENIRRAIALSPDRLVTFAYAHVPWVKAQQRQLEALGLPTEQERAEMFARGKALLEGSGYKALGLDHFVRPDDPLYTALQTGQLHRNFQGYCTRATTGQVYAFGVTAISQLTAAYAQNTKSIEQYLERIAAGQLPIERGYALGPSEQIAGEVIASIMCNGHARWAELAETLALSAEELNANLYRDEALLAELEADGLITRTSEGLHLNPVGQPFVRIVASAFDPLMADNSRPRPYSMAL